MGIKETIYKQWVRINPYFSDLSKTDELGKRNIIEILDDLYNTTDIIVPRLFVKPLSDFSDQLIMRGRRGEWYSKEQLNPPTIDVAEKNRIINRWNPPNKRYLYLSVGTDYENTLATIKAEMRAINGETITVGEFEFITNVDTMLIADLDYDRISRNEIFKALEIEKTKETEDILDTLYGREVFPTEAEIKKEIEKRNKDIAAAVTAFCGQLTLKEICDVIFVPLDDDEDCDNGKKDKCYKSFHILAEYYESKGYAGISFSSTRMKKQGKKGSNLVLFNADIAQAKQETINTIIV